MKTDWTARHKKPFFLSALTRRITCHHLISALKKNDFPEGGSILELGGAASSFQKALSEKFSPSVYAAADNCQTGLEMLPDSCRKISCDLLSESQDLPVSDLVFSIGLIEHFTPEETGKLIRLHLQLTKEGGLTILSFPEPTRLYRSIRAMAEFFKCWHYPDERPLFPEEVISAAVQNPVYSKLISGNILTQRLLVFRKK